MAFLVLYYGIFFSIYYVLMFNCIIMLSSHKAYFISFQLSMNGDKRHDNSCEVSARFKTQDYWASLSKSQVYR